MNAMKQSRLILCMASLVATALLFATNDSAWSNDDETSAVQTTDTESPAAVDNQPTSAEEQAPAEDEPVETQTLLVHDDQLRLVVPASWKLVKPRNNLIEVELTILPREEEEMAEDTKEEPNDDQPLPRGRLTMMSAGGDVEANIRRWVGQFRLGRDADGKDAMRRDERRLRGAVANVLDIAGTYFDTPRGPFGPKVELSDYRMLGAIIEVEGAGKYFVKFYGPAEIVEENVEAFEEMLSSLELVEPATDQEEPSEPAKAETAAS